MGVLDTFYILFKTDADKAAEEIAHVGTASKEAEAGLFAADAMVGRLGASFVGLAVTLAAPIAAFASLGGAISLALTRVNEVDDIGDAAFKLRSTTQEYDAISRAAKAAGVGAMDFQANMAMFSDKLNDAAARPDGPNAKNFNKWGIHFKDAKGEALGAVDGILALAKSLEHVSQAEQIGRMRRLGIKDSDTIGFILQGTKAIEEQMQAQKDAGVVTDEQIQIAGDYQMAVGGATNVLDTFANRVMGLVIPAMSAGLNAFSKTFGWLLDHTALVKGFFIGVAGAVTVFLIPALWGAVTAAGALIVELAILIAPFLAIAAAIAAVGIIAALVYEDLSAYFNGQNSLIGELLKKYDWLVQDIKAAWDQIVGFFSAAWGAIQPVLQAIVDGATDLATRFIESLAPIRDAWNNLFGALGDLAKAVFDRILADVQALIPGWMAAFEDMKADLVNAFQQMGQALQPLIDGVKLAASAIGDIFSALGEKIKAIWSSTIGWIADGINSLVEKIRGLTGTISGAGQSAPPLPARPGQPALPTPTENAERGGAAIGNMFRPKLPATPQQSGAIEMPASDSQQALARPSGAPTNVIRLAMADINRAGAGDGGLGSQTPAGITAANQNNSRTYNSPVTVGSVTVNTQATDAKGVAAAVKGELQNQLRATASHFDDGVDR